MMIAAHDLECSVSFMRNAALARGERHGEGTTASRSAWRTGPTRAAWPFADRARAGMMHRFDAGARMTVINCDMGESFSLYHLGDDAALMPFLDVANVACGFHASDFNVMRDTVRLAKAHGVKVGAHPSFPDLQGFGRREMKFSRHELANCILYQVGALSAFCRAEGVEMYHLKPHGALYGMAARDAEVAHAVADAAEIFGLPVMGMKGTQHEAVYTARGLRFITEYYADLEYNDDGYLIITRKHDAVDAQRAAERCRRAVAEGVTVTVSGREIPVGADAICVHSDTPNAREIAAAVRAALAPWLRAA